MSEIVFEEPPRLEAYRWSSNLDAAAQLRERPGEWARIGAYSTGTSARSMAQSIKTGQRRAWAPAGAYEAISRTVDGEHRVYARYVGDSDG
jgi:hypothetical protein